MQRLRTTYCYVGDPQKCKCLKFESLVKIGKHFPSTSRELQVPKGGELQVPGGDPCSAFQLDFFRCI